MPELPEVETVRRGVADYLTGQRIVEVQGSGGRLVRNNPQGMIDVVSTLQGAVVSGVERRGKFMWLTLADSDLALVIHLGMSGQVRVRDLDLSGESSREPEPLQKHEHIRLVTKNNKVVSCIDPRMFGQVTASVLAEDPTGRLVPERLLGLAPDPFEDVPPELFTARLKKTRKAIKTALLDQTIVSGVGNIYADEALFEAGVHGRRPSASLGQKALLGLIESAREVMAASLEAGGTSFDSLYVNAEGDPGYFARSLHVYGRAGEPCGRCGRLLEREVIQGRSHFFCRTCQSVPRSPSPHHR